MRELTHDEVVAVTRGVCAVEHDGSDWAFRRFPLTAMAHYAPNEGQAIRTRCPAGVLLDFLTDSKTLSVAARIGAGARPHAFFNLVVDDTLTGVLGDMEPAERIEGAIPCGCHRRGLRRFRLYLPHVRNCVLESVALSDGATVEPCRQGPLWLALGDSITQGMNGLHPALTYAATAARRQGLALHNCGVGGAVFEKEGLPEKPVARAEVVTIAYGINDWLHGVPPEAARGVLQQVAAFYPDARILTLEPTWYGKNGETADGPNDGGMTLEAYRRQLRAIVGEFSNVTLVPNECLVPPGPQFMPDGCHPDTTGQMIYGHNLSRFLPDTRLAAGD